MLKAKFERSSNWAGQARKADLRRQENGVNPAPSPAARNLALAHHIERLIHRGLIADYTQAARMLGVSQPRMTHLMGLLVLAPAIQEAILVGELAPKDKELRALARVAGWRAQVLERPVGFGGELAGGEPYTCDPVGSRREEQRPSP